MANILIVEDSKSMASSQAYILWEAGHTVQFATSGKEALRQVEEVGFDLVLLDYELPDINGLEVFRAIRQTDHRTLVIMITGKGDEQLAAQVIKEGARDYLIKSDGLLAALPRVVEQVLREEKTQRKLEDKDLALRRAYDTLEKRVAERTEALARANEQLHSEISYREDVDRALRESNEQMIGILESINDGFFSLDNALTVGYCNPAAERMFNRKKEELQGRNLFAAFPEFRDTVFENLFTQALSERAPLDFEVHFEVEPYSNWYAVRVFPQKEGITVHFQVTTERKLTEKRLEKLAHYDILTQLPNRALFNDRLSQAIERGNRYNQLVAVMMIDLDRFKEINDTLGHRAGDQLLKDVAERFLGCIRRIDTVSRLGGDEFAVVLPDVKQEEKAAMIARRFLASLEKPFKIEGHEIYVTASVGITIYPTDTKEADHMTKNADMAMYYAKDKGRNNYQFFSPFMNRNAVEKFMIESDLRSALRKEEFILHYQPKVNTVTGMIVGVEALVRWIHPDQGMVSPVKFIPVAEDTGLIVPLGEWVLREACRQNRAWQNMGLLPMHISVNVSARQFHKKEFPDDVEMILKETGLDPGYLEIEITESVLIRDVRETLQILEKLKKLGLSLSIDDFGTGYSSLSYLRRFPLDVLKIDRSFVNDIATDSDSRAVVSSIIGLAHNLNLKVIAEGVETREQLQFLKERGCDELQGFYFSKPIRNEELMKLLEDRKLRLPRES